MDPWQVVKAYTKNNPTAVVEHHLRSFNHFCEEGIQETLQKLKSLEQKRERSATSYEISRIRLGDVRIVPPKIRPEYAIARDVNYSFKVYVQVSLQHIQRREGAPDVLEKTDDMGELLFCTLPAMVHSSVCLLETEEWNDNDLGGYFIINGHERYLPLVEQKDPTSVFIHESKEGLTAELHGIKVILRADNALEYHGDIDVLLPGKKKAYPLFVVMRAYGLLSDADVVNHCLLGNDIDLLAPYLVPSVHASGKIFNTTLAAAYVGGTDDDTDETELVYRIGRMVRKLLMVQIGVKKVSDPQSLEHLCLETSGDLLHRVFEKECAVWQEKWATSEFGNVRAYFQQAREIGKTIAEQITEPLSEDRLFSLRKVIRLAHGMHATHFGFYDVVTSNELATMVRVSETPSKESMQTLMTMLAVVPLQGATAKEHGKLVRVVLDGKQIGSLNNINDFFLQLKDFRTTRLDFNVSLNGMELSIRSRKGRLQRPTLLATSLSVVSYVDSEEISTAYVATSVESVEPRHTHVEIHGSFLYGQKANQTLVFANHTPVSLSHAACTFKTTTTDQSTYLKTEVSVQELQDHQIPMVRSIFAPTRGAEGANVTVAFMCYEQNAVTFNKAAVDRGLFRSYRIATKYTTKTDYKVGDTLAGGWKVVQLFWTKAEKQKIRLRKEYDIEVGTIFSTRGGFQGVCSAIVPEKDMPFSASTGFCPDVIVNPLLIESVACLLEALCGKVHVARGSIGDGTAFQPEQTTEKYLQELKKGGKYRDDSMIDGKTGIQLQTAVFVGPLYLRCAKKEEESVCVFGEQEHHTALAHGMTAVVRDAVVSRKEHRDIMVDVANGVQALQNDSKGILVAPELDGPIEFDGQMKPVTAKKHANRFVSLRLPKDTCALLAELRMMNIQTRFMTRPFDIWSNTKNDGIRSCVFRSLSTDALEMLDNTLYVSHTPVGCSDLVDTTLFPTIATKEWMLRILIGAIEIAPTADSKRALHNEDKLHLDVYSNMDWRSARQTLLYCFRKMNGGVFVRIQNNRVANFLPIRNSGFNNDFSDRLSLDGKEAANMQALETLVHDRSSKWVAVGNTVEQNDTDTRLAQMYDMLVNTCSRMVVHDCLVVFNHSDFPYLGAEFTETNPALYGPNKKVDSLWKKTGFIPILSPCTTENHADLAIPTSDDWEGITQDYFTTVQDDAKVCKNRYLFGEITPWANRTATVVKSENDLSRTLPVFYWRGLADGGEHHPRTLLEEATKRYSKERKGAAVKVGVLDAATIPSPAVRLSHKSENNLIVVHPAKRRNKDDLAPKIKLMEQAKKYKFTFNVEGVAASYRLGALFRLGFCVLHVETPYQLWFERLMDREGAPLLKGGDIEDFQDDWMYLSVRRDLSNMERTIEWCIENDEKCKRVAENAKHFYAAYFTKQYVYEYMASTLNAISGRQHVTERSVSEEQTWLKDITSTYDTLQQLPKLVRHSYEVAGPMSLKNTVVIVLCRGKDHHIALQQWLKHHHKNNVLIVKQAEGTFNKGALLNAAFLYISTQCPEIDTFVFTEPEALFNTDFAQRYFGADGKDVVDFGKMLSLPSTWALKVSKDVFRKVNGFPNNMPMAGENEAFENRLRINEVPLYTPTMRPMLKGPSKKEDKKTDARAALVMDALQWRFDGINTLQFAVTKIKVGNWTLKPSDDDPNLRTLTIRLAPDVEFADLQQKKNQEQKNSEKPNKSQTSEQPVKKEGGSEIEEPSHLKTIDLAYIHPTHMNADLHGGKHRGRIISILDDDAPVQHEKLEFIENTETMPTDRLSNVKEVKMNL